MKDFFCKYYNCCPDWLTTWCNWPFLNSYPVWSYSSWFPYNISSLSVIVWYLAWFGTWELFTQLFRFIHLESTMMKLRQYNIHSRTKDTRKAKLFAATLRSISVSGIFTIMNANTCMIILFWDILHFTLYISQCIIPFIYLHLIVSNGLFKISPLTKKNLCTGVKVQRYPTRESTPSYTFAK